MLISEKLALLKTLRFHVFALLIGFSQAKCLGTGRETSQSIGRGMLQRLCQCGLTLSSCGRWSPGEPVLELKP